MDDNTFGYAMILLTIGLSWLAFRTAFYGMKLLAGIWWFVMFIYLQSSPPDPVTEGSGLHTGLLVVCIGFGLTIPLVGLGRGINKTQIWNIGAGSSSESSEGFKFKIPSWMRSSGNSYEEYNRKMTESNDEYQSKMRTALRRGKENNRKR